MAMQLEPLEPRRLLSAYADFRGGTIFITGTDDADAIAFEAGRSIIAVHVNGVVTRFDAPRVRAIEINALGGDDRIVLGASLRIGAKVFAGDGNDTVSGGRGADTIFGGAGNDFISGRDGDDYLDGNAGDDTFEDWHGINTVHGGGGRDSGLIGAGALVTGVESHRAVYELTGVARKHDIYTVDPDEPGSGTRFVRDDNGRVYLEYYGATGSGSNRVEISELQRRRDGQWEITVTITTPPPGYGSTADMKYFDRRWDVTRVAAQGVVFTRKIVNPGSQEYNVETKVTTQSNVLLLPASATRPTLA